MECDGILDNEDCYLFEGQCDTYEGTWAYISSFSTLEEEEKKLSIFFLAVSSSFSPSPFHHNVALHVPLPSSSPNISHFSPTLNCICK